MGGGEATYDLTARSPEFRAGLEFLLDEHGVEWSWRSGVLVVDEVDATDVDYALGYLDGTGSLGAATEGGDREADVGPVPPALDDDRTPLIASRQEAWWCVAGPVVLSTAFCVWLVLMSAGKPANEVGVVVLIVGGAAGFLAMFWFNTLRVRRAPDVFPGFFDRAFRFRVAPHPDLRAFDSRLEAVGVLRKAWAERRRNRRSRPGRRGRDRVGPSSAPPPPG